jgi:phage gp45-like
MVTRSTPHRTVARSYSGGGARSTVDTVDDMHFMQEMAGNMMSGEARKAIEAPQNYGFTSVCAAAAKDALGKIIDGAEVAMHYMGGSRSYPVAGAMDDRRHRLWGLDPGDSALFRLATDHMQFHMHKDGGFWSAPQDKTVRMALINEQSGQQQQVMQQRARRRAQEIARARLGVSARDGSGGGGGAGQSSDGEPEDKNGQQKGQKSLQSQNVQSKMFMHLTKDEAAHSGTNVRHYLTDGNGYYEVNQDKNVYVGALKSKAQFATVVTVKGPAKNVFGKIG